MSKSTCLCYTYRQMQAVSSYYDETSNTKWIIPLHNCVWHTGLPVLGQTSTVVQSQAESLIKLTFICFHAHSGSAAVHMLEAWPMLKDSRQVVGANHTVGFMTEL